MARLPVAPLLVLAPLLAAAVAGGLALRAGADADADFHPWIAASPLNPVVPVRLVEYSRGGPVSVRLRGAWRVFGSDGATLLEGSELQGELAVDELGARLGAFRFPMDSFHVETAGDAALRLGDRWYRGVLQVRVQRDRRELPESLDLRLEVPLEDYVVGVVCGEMATVRSGVAAALRAQAIAARTYALWRLRQGRSFLYDDTRDQRFLSVDYETDAAREAVRATAGLVLSYAGELLPAYFHADCGGTTLDAAAAGFLRRPLAPLRGVIDEGCRAGRGWEEVVEAERLDRLAREQGLGAWIRGMEVTKASGGWCLEARLEGARDTCTLRGEELRSALRLPSSLIVSFTAQEDGSLHVRGAGRGHGVGMCQVGAARLSAAGASTADILQHYYPDAPVVSLAELAPEER
ncbi:MAG: SpoIID/LytB domain-containing protein [Planctomycetota bacterium]|nr:MAG: SpoIID/LytB domain-containing protein [Planctomycetota bacterium]